MEAREPRNATLGASHRHHWIQGRHHQPMEAGETRTTVTQRRDHGALIAALWVRPPCLQGAARPVTPLRRLTLGEALGLLMALPLPQRSAFDAVPALMAVIMDTLLSLDDGAHSSLLLLQPRSWGT